MQPRTRDWPCEESAEALDFPRAVHVKNIHHTHGCRAEETALLRVEQSRRRAQEQLARPVDPVWLSLQCRLEVEIAAMQREEARHGL